jgi:hypothetical protein
MASEAPEALILDLLEWLAARARTHDETMDAWRTSCPKLTVWEDATDRGLIRTKTTDGQSLVYVTSAGAEFLKKFRVAPRSA